MTVHTGAETIQGRKQFKGGNYSRKYGIIEFNRYWRSELSIFDHILVLYFTIFCIEPDCLDFVTCNLDTLYHHEKFQMDGPQLAISL